MRQQQIEAEREASLLAELERDRQRLAEQERLRALERQVEEERLMWQVRSPLHRSGDFALDS